jgi:hypothetical protein
MRKEHPVTQSYWFLPPFPSREQSTADASDKAASPVEATAPRQVQRDPIEAWNAAIETETAKHGGSRDKAIAAVVAKNPTLHREYLTAFNERR